MIETNTRIVEYGQRLIVWVKRARVSGSHIDPKLLQRACNKMQSTHGLAAVPLPVEQASLLIATRKPIPSMELQEDEWELRVEDAGEPCFRLRLSTNKGKRLIPILIERALISRIARHTKFWRLDSWRIWYEPEPFRSVDGIAAYRRYEISTSPIEDVGLGVTVGVSTAFFTENDLTFYLSPTLPHEERVYRRKLFERLTQRQERQKGTLLYDNGQSKSKCYFVDNPKGMTCQTTGIVRRRSKSYCSLIEYYRDLYPNLPVEETDQAVLVSFNGIPTPQPVAAKRLYARVMNEKVPKSMKALDKILPATRSKLAAKFWNCLGENPLGKGIPRLMSGFWQPSNDRIHQLEMPTLHFGKGEKLLTPEATLDAYSENYFQRIKYLEKFGCYYVPPTMERTLYFAVPNSIGETARNQLMDDLTGIVYKFANRPLGTVVPIVYSSVSDALVQLRAYQPGAVVFVLNDDANAYHEVAFQLDRWRIKRMTSRVLCEKYQRLCEGDEVADRGARQWHDFLVENALDVLQQLDVIPFRVENLGPYEAMLVIDVGQDRRYQALSLLIMREHGHTPEHALVRHVHVKPDIHSEAINPKLLADHIVELVNAAVRTTRYPLGSMLVIRDGKTCSGEPGGVAEGISRLKTARKVTESARIDEVDLYKDTLKHSRFWETDGRVFDNPLEGKLIYQNANTSLLASTGAATLRQGTAVPLTIISNGRCSSILDAAQAIFAACQLNWSSPKVAQRLPLPLKVTDEELTARSAQEIRRIR